MWFGWRISGHLQGQRAKSNTISSLAVSSFAFLAIATFRQLLQPVNVYFLMITVLSYTQFSNKNAWIMTITFAIIITFGICQETFQNRNEQRSYSDLNFNTVLVLDYGKLTYVLKKWSEVCVGDIIKVMKDETFPADVLLLYSPCEVALVDTNKIDGEMGIRPKH